MNRETLEAVMDRVARDQREIANTQELYHETLIKLNDAQIKVDTLTKQHAADLDEALKQSRNAQRWQADFQAQVDRNKVLEKLNWEQNEQFCVEFGKVAITVAKLKAKIKKLKGGKR